MKRCGFFLLIYLSFGMRSLLFSQEALSSWEDSTRIVIKNTQDTRELQQQIEPQKKEEPQDKIKIKMTGNLLVIEELPEDGVLEIYNIMGAKVFNRRVKAGTNQCVFRSDRVLRHIWCNLS